MPELRDALSATGLHDVRTYVQSGNVVFSSDADPGELEGEIERLIAERFGLEVDVVVRTSGELADVVAQNPLADVAVEPKRYQVTFLGEPLGPDEIERLSALAAGSERFIADGREVYAWHPDGVARSKLWARLGSKGLGVKATSRNWATVTTLLEMAQER
jgi:uncharacterized protein (DUF1697 family)